MSYAKPSIDASGLHASTYTEIRDYLISEFKRIFGDDLYLGEDTQDYQMISIFSDAADDISSLLSLVYSSHDPDYATGHTLDLIMALNGLTRKSATYSRALLTLSGTAGVVVLSGSIVRDTSGQTWTTESTATIGQNGTITVYAKCSTAGAITAASGTITEIVTPTSGWISVTNASSATVGSDKETDSEARARRALAVSNTSVSLLTSLYGALSSIESVEKLRLYENSTATTDTNGIPAGSICAVVLGGDNQDVADTIFKKKSIGCGTFGSTTVQVTDVYGQTASIKFSRPTEVAVSVSLGIKSLSTYTSDMTAQIKSNVAAYISSLGIGDTLNVGLLWSTILSVNKDLSDPSFSPVSLTAQRIGGSASSTEVTSAYNELLTCSASAVTITITT